MNREQLMVHHEELCKMARDLMSRKNHDYAGSEGDSPWMNFQRSEIMGICKTQQAFMVRIMDKVSRLITFINNGELMVKEEGVEDSIIDIINYMVLLSAFLKDKRMEEAAKTFTAGVYNGDQPCYNAVGDERFDKEETPEPFAEMT
tara:strand:+ start:593 stop:1030 length:438 start_codon:yes stop_codon:yes gene_type:complete